MRAHTIATMGTSSAGRVARLGLALLASSLWSFWGCESQDAPPSSSVTQVAIVAPDLDLTHLEQEPTAPVELLVQLVDEASELDCGIAFESSAAQDSLPSVGAWRHARPTVHRSYGKLGMVHVTVAASDVDKLARCSSVARISPNRPLRPVGKSSKQASDAFISDFASRTIGASAVQEGASGASVDGSGVVVAVFDSGVATHHRAFSDNASDWWLGQLTFKGSGKPHFSTGAGTDPYGHGTLVAGAIASQAEHVTGAAPNARLLGVNLLDKNGVGKVSDAIAAIDWLITHGASLGVRVINFSLTAPPSESYATDPLGQAIVRAVEAGIVVVAAAGNLGWWDDAFRYGGIGSPANHPAVITVGAADTQQTITRSDDTVAWFSSRGPTLIDGVTKPDLVAPGVDLTLPLPAGSRLHRQRSAAQVTVPGSTQHPWVAASGTSFSAPLVSATVALMLEAQPQLHPTAVKAILQATAQTLMAGSDSDRHPLAAGTGLLNALGAVELAQIWNTDPSLEEGDPNLLEPISDTPISVIEGEDVLWGTGIIWNGMVAFESWWQQHTYADYFFGDLRGTGIIWNGMEADQGQVFWLDYNVSGVDLIRRHQSAWSGDVLWGTGIIWNGRVTYYDSASFGTYAQQLWWNALVSLSMFDAPLASSGPIQSPTPSDVRQPTSVDGAGWIHIPSFGNAP